MRISHVWMNAALAFGFGVAGAGTISSMTRVERDVDRLVRDLSPPVTIHRTRSGGRVGRTLLIEAHATRHRDCQLSVSTRIEPEDGPMIARGNPNRITLAEGETAWVRIPVTLPPDLAPGRYRVRSTGEYVCHDGRVFVVPTGWVNLTL